MTSASSTICPMLTKSAMKMKKGRRCRGKFWPKLQGSCRCTQERGTEVSEAEHLLSLNLIKHAKVARAGNPDDTADQRGVPNATACTE